jgi:DNA polymerase-1
MRLVMIDGNSLLFRAYFAMRPMVTKDGVYTQGVFAFINMLKKILDDYEPDYIGVAFDMRAKTFRHEKYPEYKAGRLKTPVELLSEIPIMHTVLDAMNIRTMEMETFEADDIIGTVTAKASESGIESYIITGDKDELQLVDGNTKVVINRKGMTEFDVYDEAAMQERYGLTPTQFIDLKGLMGDKSDNIPGVPGIGEKKGTALLKEYGSVEGVLDHADEIKGKMGENIRANADMARLSKELATIKRDVPIEFTFDELKYTEPDYDRLVEVYKKLEFNAFLNRLNRSTEADLAGEDEKRSEEEISKIETVTAEGFLSAVEKGSDVVVSFETDGNHLAKPEMDSYSLFSPEKNIYTRCELTPLDAGAQLERLRDAGFRLTGHSVKDGIYTAMSYGVYGFDLAHDTEVAEYLIDPNRSRYDLDKMLVKYTGISLGGEDIQDDIHRLYYIHCVAAGQRKYIDEHGLGDVMDEIEMPLIEVMASMEHCGMQVEEDVLKETGRDLDEKIASLESSVYEKAGREFNINSPKQLGTVLFDELGLPYPKRSKGKNGWSTSADVLDKLKGSYPIVSEVLEYRKYTKLKGTYIDGLLSLIADDGRIHPHFNQTVAATGRISCTEPNLQNIPVRDDYGRNIRKAFVAPEGRTFVSADYSQIELRILAALSGDEELIAAFNRGDDIHRITASRVFEIPYDEVTPLDRSRAKAVNFGVIYGMSGFGLSEELMITRSEAQRYIDEYFEKHPAVKKFLDDQIETCKKEKCVRTISGRIRQIPEIDSRKYMERQLANRLAMNTPIQGSAADIIKIAMNSVYRELRGRGMKSSLVLQVHDELIIEADDAEIDDVKDLLVRNMQSAADLSVDLICDLNTGKTWYELK